MLCAELDRADDEGGDDFHDVSAMRRSAGIGGRDWASLKCGVV
jgi:hypothetical protein